MPTPHHQSPNIVHAATQPPMRPLPVVTLLCALLLPCAMPAVEPSDNAGRSGTYEVVDQDGRYNYWVSVPGSYAEDQPAGLHLFFHGQGGANGAQHFGGWSKHLLERHNLIGINMAYLDGDNGKDTAGKVAAAKEAVAQVMADYRVLPRGIAASFSGGGLPHGLWWQDRGEEWPFTMNCLYGSNFWRGISRPHELAWFIGIGTGEWNMGQPTLGQSQTARFRELCEQLARGANPLVRLLITPGKGHKVGNEDRSIASDLFAIEDAFSAPLVHPARAGEDRSARQMVDLLNARAFGQVQKHIERLSRRSEDGQNADPLVDLIAVRMESAIDGMLTRLQQLATSDAFTFQLLAKRAHDQLRGHDRTDELRELIKTVQKNDARRAHLHAQQIWLKVAGSLFLQGPTVDQPELREALQQVVSLAPESLAGIMAAESLALDH